jgi:hypothetical protein
VLVVGWVERVLQCKVCDDRGDSSALVSNPLSFSWREGSSAPSLPPSFSLRGEHFALEICT